MNNFSYFLKKQLLLILIGMIFISIVYANNGTNEKENINNISLQTYLNQIFLNVDFNKGPDRYHLENFLIFMNNYSALYDASANDLLFDYLFNKLKENQMKISIDLEKDPQRLNILQLMYLYSQVLKNRTKFVSDFDKNSDKLLKIYNFLLDEIVLRIWYNLPAWHWSGKFPNMHTRILAKLNHDQKVTKRNYYSAIIDEEGFTCSIGSDLLFIYNNFSEKLKMKNIHKKIKKLRAIISLCTEIIKSKTTFGKSNSDFHFAKGDWSDHPDYHYAGCEQKTYPQKKCIISEIEPDISHFSRFPWWIESLKDAFHPTNPNYQYFQNWLFAFANHFQKKLLHHKNGLFLLSNYINGTNGWYRVGYHKEYPQFGYGPFQLSTISALGSYYKLAKYNKKLCNYIQSMKKNFHNKHFLLRLYYDEKFPTTYTNFLKKTGLYKSRYQLYYMIADSALKMWCSKQ